MTPHGASELIYIKIKANVKGKNVIGNHVKHIPAYIMQGNIRKMTTQIDIYAQSCNRTMTYNDSIALVIIKC